MSQTSQDSREVCPASQNSILCAYISAFNDLQLEMKMHHHLSSLCLQGSLSSGGLWRLRRVCPCMCVCVHLCTCTCGCSQGSSCQADPASPPLLSPGEDSTLQHTVHSQPLTSKPPCSEQTPHAVLGQEALTVQWMGERAMLHLKYNGSSKSSWKIGYYHPPRVAFSC